MTSQRGKRGKKGQAAAAAVLLAIIAGIMLMIIIVVSPEEREAILNEANVSDFRDEHRSPAEILVDETPGKIDYLELGEVEHSLASVRIYTREESEILAEKFSGYTKNGVFSEEKISFPFSLSDVSNTQDVLLNFAVEEAQGNLVILFNGEEIFNSPVGSGENPIIPISEHLLLSSNEIEFLVSGPGGAFWKTNFATLKNIKIVGKVTEKGFQSATNTFLVSETEYNNMESLELRFQPECDYETVGRLNVAVNGANVYSGIPDCGLRFVPIELSPNIIQRGENSITFSTEKGEYILLHLEVVSDLKEIDYPTYFFELTLEEWENVDDADNFVEVTLRFTDDTDRKEGYVQINGRKRHFSTRDLSYTIDISDAVVRGNNAIKLQPSQTLEVREFEVKLR